MDKRALQDGGKASEVEVLGLLEIRRHLRRKRQLPLHLKQSIGVDVERDIRTIDRQLGLLLSNQSSDAVASNPRTTGALVLGGVLPVAVEGNRGSGQQLMMPVALKGEQLTSSSRYDDASLLISDDDEDSGDGFASGEGTPVSALASREKFTFCLPASPRPPPSNPTPDFQSFKLGPPSPSPHLAPFYAHKCTQNIQSQTYPETRSSCVQTSPARTPAATQTLPPKYGAACQTTPSLKRMTETQSETPVSSSSERAPTGSLQRALLFDSCEPPIPDGIQQQGNPLTQVAGSDGTEDPTNIEQEFDAGVSVPPEEEDYTLSFATQESTLDFATEKTFGGGDGEQYQRVLHNKTSSSPFPSPFQPATAAGGGVVGGDNLAGLFQDEASEGGGEGSLLEKEGCFEGRSSGCEDEDEDDEDVRLVLSCLEAAKIGSAENARGSEPAASLLEQDPIAAEIQSLDHSMHSSVQGVSLVTGGFSIPPEEWAQLLTDASQNRGGNNCWDADEMLEFCGDHLQLDEKLVAAAATVAAAVTPDRRRNEQKEKECRSSPISPPSSSIALLLSKLMSSSKMDSRHSAPQEEEEEDSQLGLEGVVGMGFVPSPPELTVEADGSLSPVRIFETGSIPTLADKAQVLLDQTEEKQADSGGMAGRMSFAWEELSPASTMGVAGSTAPDFSYPSSDSEDDQPSLSHVPLWPSAQTPTKEDQLGIKRRTKPPAPFISCKDSPTEEAPPRSANAAASVSAAVTGFSKRDFSLSLLASPQPTGGYAGKKQEAALSASLRDSQQSSAPNSFFSPTNSSAVDSSTASANFSPDMSITAPAHQTKEIPSNERDIQQEDVMHATKAVSHDKASRREPWLLGRRASPESFFSPLSDVINVSKNGPAKQQSQDVQDRQEHGFERVQMANGSRGPLLPQQKATRNRQVLFGDYHNFSSHAEQQQAASKQGLSLEQAGLFP